MSSFLPVPANERNESDKRTSIDALFEDQDLPLPHPMFLYDVIGNMGTPTLTSYAGGTASNSDSIDLIPTLDFEFENSMRQSSSSSSSDHEIVGIDQNGMQFQWDDMASVFGAVAAVGDEGDGQSLMNDGELSQLVQCYLLDPSDECTVLVQSTKITQKSYGVEKRFLCPPTQVTLIGTRWHQDQFPAQAVILQPHHVSSRRFLATTSGSVHVSKVVGEFLRVDLLSTTSHLRDSFNLLYRTRVVRGLFPHVFVNESDARQMDMSVDVWCAKNNLVSQEGDDCDEGNDVYVGKRKEQAAMIESVGRFVFGSQGIIEFQGNGEPKDAKGVVRVSGIKSSLVRVVSKPTKRVSVAEQIYSGSQVVLFNRLKAQKITTKYLASDHHGTELSVTYPNWQSWYIWNLNDENFDPSKVPSESPLVRKNTQKTGSTQKHDASKTDLVWVKGDARVGLFKDDSDFSEAIIDAHQVSNPTEENDSHLKFGDVVVLQNAVTGLVTCPLVLTHSDRLSDDRSVDDFQDVAKGMPVGQLNRLCLVLWEDEKQFLVLSLGSVVETALVAQDTGSSTSRNAAKKRAFEKNVMLGENSIWTIVGIDQAEYSFWKYPASQNLFNDDCFVSPVGQIPAIFSFQQVSGCRWLLSGQNFSQSLCCFFGRFQAIKTEVLCGECMMVEFAVGMSCDWDEPEDAQPVLLVDRADGVIFRSGFYHHNETASPKPVFYVSKVAFVAILHFKPRESQLTKAKSVRSEDSVITLIEMDAFDSPENDTESDIQFKGSQNERGQYDAFSSVEQSLTDLALVKGKPEHESSRYTNMFSFQSLYQSPKPITVVPQLQSPTVNNRYRWARHDGARKDRLYGKVRDLGAALDLLKHNGSSGNSVVGSSCGASIQGDVSPMPTATCLPLSPIAPKMRKRVAPKFNSAASLKSPVKTNSVSESSVALQSKPAPASGHTTVLMEEQPVDDPFVAAAYALMFINNNGEVPPALSPALSTSIPQNVDEPISPVRMSLRKRRSGGAPTHSTNKRRKTSSPRTDTSFLYSPPISEDGAFVISKHGPFSNLRTPTKGRDNERKDLIILPEIDDNDDFYAESEDEEQSVQFRRSTPISTATTPKCQNFLKEQRELLHNYLNKAGVSQQMEVTSGEEEMEEESRL
ncbi:hypothetical protein HDU99_002201 [Rhizoclosmatium hyalinum]|nr:hypothetical protein HDU99_002201 [Rhizoclosmatium hyalinum]